MYTKIIEMDPGRRRLLGIDLFRLYTNAEEAKGARTAIINYVMVVALVRTNFKRGYMQKSCNRIMAGATVRSRSAS